MANVYEYIVPQGVIIPDTTEIQNQVIAEFKNVFGDDLIVTPDTPQGLLIVIETLARISVAANNAQLANQINPALAGGVYLDAIGALTGSQRNPEEFTIVNADLTGVAGTIIPAGSQAKDSSNGEIFESLEIVTLAIDGTGNIDFRALNAGSINVAPNTLTQIVSNVLGWETVNNPSNGTPGSETQSDAAFRLLRKQTLFAQGSSLAAAIISAILEVDGVKSVYFRENISPDTEVIDGTTMVGHSIYACVDGGSDIDVANALVSKKSGGCAYNNGNGINIDQEVIVPYSNQIMDVLFDRPDIIPILVRATVKVSSSIIDPVTAVKNAITDYANGLIEGEPGLVVGQSVSTFELAGAVNIEDRGIYVQNMETSLTSPIDYSNDEIIINGWEKAAIDADNINVIVIS